MWQLALFIVSTLGSLLQHRVKSSHGKHSMSLIGYFCIFKTRMNTGHPIHKRVADSKRSKERGFKDVYLG